MLANRYRPQKLQDTTGQASVVKILTSSVEKDMVAPAMLFIGPSGTGKTTIARALARAINCTSPVKGDACNTCDTCKSTQEHNVFEYDAASRNGVDDIRSIVEQLRYKPSTGKYKVIILDEVHMLSQAAYNALLKSLEEPPDYVKFIFCTTEPHKVLETVKSRCQVHHFKAVSAAEIAQRLKEVSALEAVEIDDNSLQLISINSGGNLRNAMFLLEKVISITDKALYADVQAILGVVDSTLHFRMLEGILGKDPQEIIAVTTAIFEAGHNLQQYLTVLRSHCRDLLLCKSKNPMLDLLNTDASLTDKYVEESKKYSTDFLTDLLKQLSQCDTGYEKALNKRLHVELALIEAAKINDT